MSEYRVAVAYAKSVLTLAEEKKKLAQVYEDMQYARDVFEASRELKLAIKSPILSPVKSEILGGFIVSSGDRQIDASVKTRLQKLKHQFSQNPYIPKY